MAVSVEQFLTCVWLFWTSIMVVRIVSVPSMETFEPCDCSKGDVNGDPTIEFWSRPGTEQRGRKNKQSCGVIVPKKCVIFGAIDIPVTSVFFFFFL